MPTQDTKLLPMSLNSCVTYECESYPETHDDCCNRSTRKFPVPENVDQFQLGLVDLRLTIYRHWVCRSRHRGALRRNGQHGILRGHRRCDDRGLETRAGAYPRPRPRATQYDAVVGVDAPALFTEWMPFRLPNFGAMKNLMRRPVIIDRRNQYDPQHVREEGFEYFGIGR